MSGAKRKSKMANLCGGAGHRGTCSQPPGILCQDDEEADDRADDVKGHLHHVGPDDGGHAAFEGVKERQARRSGRWRSSSPVPRTMEITSEMAKTRTPSARARVTRNMDAVSLRMRSPNRRRISS